MGRKNRRVDEIVRLPESVADLGIPRPSDGRSYRLETREERDERIRAEWVRRRNRLDARIDARVAEAVDWNTCCIPGCDTTLPEGRKPKVASGMVAAPNDRHRDVSKRLPICQRHEVIISNMVAPHFATEDYWQVRRSLARQYVETDLARIERSDLVFESNGAEQGQIYFVRLNGMIKVGWASRLRSRLKAYGASAEVLAHYPASRQDETLMHRQLKPALAKGREWYHDGPLINDVIAGVVERHGKPTIFPTWTVPKPDIVAGKHHR